MRPRTRTAVQVVGQRNAAAPQLFKQREVSFEKLGIGGLDQQFEQIFRRAFASRVFPPEMVRRVVSLPYSTPHLCSQRAQMPRTRNRLANAHGV